MKYVQLLYHYQINSLNLFVKDITAFIEIHQFICFLQAFKQWGSGGKGTKTLPIVYTKWYIPVVAYGNNINWQPENSAVTAYKVSLSQLNIWAKEGSNFWFITVGI